LNHEETVRLRTLESWSLSSGINDIDVLKLDVEGHEMDVLRGAGETLRRVRVIQWEFGGCNIDTRTYFQDFWYFLTEAGFKISRLGPRGALSRSSVQRTRGDIFHDQLLRTPMIATSTGDSRQRTSPSFVGGPRHHVLSAGDARDRPSWTRTASGSS
jgi:hypothetical protein